MKHCIDNFNLVEPFFTFKKGDNMFLHCQLVVRNKDFKDTSPENKGVVKYYILRSLDELLKNKEDIKQTCELYGARAYINPTVKSLLKLQNLMLSKLASYNLEGTIINPMKLVNSSAGELKGEHPLWIVDIDNLEQQEQFSNYNKGNLVKAKYLIPTVSCCHIITEPFDSTRFHCSLPEIEFHRNSGTLLYYPESLCKE